MYRGCSSASASVRRGPWTPDLVAAVFRLRFCRYSRSRTYIPRRVMLYSLKDMLGPFGSPKVFVLRMSAFSIISPTTRDQMMAARAAIFSSSLLDARLNLSLKARFVARFFFGVGVESGAVQQRFDTTARRYDYRVRRADAKRF